MGLFNFRPSVRPVPLEVHIQGFPGKHYCPRMATMNKPCFQCKQTGRGFKDQCHKSHNVPVPYPTVHQFVTKMCTFLSQLGRGMVHYAICEIGLLGIWRKNSYDFDKVKGDE